MANTQCISTQEAVEYLSRDGGRVPCSRYGYDGASCAPVAVLVAEIIARETGEELDEERLEHAMGLVVNDHDDPAYLIHEYRVELRRRLLEGRNERS